MFTVFCQLPKQIIIVVTQPYLMMTFIWTSATRVLDGDPHAWSMSHSRGGCGFALRNCTHGWTRSSRGSGAVIEKDNVDDSWSTSVLFRCANPQCDEIERVDEGEKKKPHYLVTGTISTPHLYKDPSSTCQTILTNDDIPHRLQLARSLIFWRNCVCLGAPT